MRSGSSQKGIHALFTARKEKSHTKREAIGLLAIGVGVAVWTWALLVFTGTIQLAIVSDRTSSAIILLSLSIPLLATGSTVFAYSRVSRGGTSEEDIDLETLAPTAELPTKRDIATQPPIFSPESGQRSSRAVIAALVEGGIIILLYGWLVREYDSSIYMRDWVQSNMPLAATVMNDNAFFLLMGIVIASTLFFLQAKRARH